MPRVTFENFDQSFEAHDGDTILSVALNHDLPIQHVCGGFCACATCQIEVTEGLENLSPREEDESDRLQDADTVTACSRLACQSKIRGDVRVRIVNLED